MTELNGAKITDKMIEVIKSWQSVSPFEDVLSAFDCAVTFIATEHMCPSSGNEKNALRIISDLCILKQELSVFSGKEECDE